MDCYRPLRSVAVEAADIASRLVKTHQAVNERHRIKCGVDRVR